LDTTRDFFVGNLPPVWTQFGIQLSKALGQAFPEIEFGWAGRPWSNEEFSQVSLSTPESTRGGLLAGALLLILGSLGSVFLWVYFRVVEIYEVRAVIAPFVTFILIFVVGLLGSLEPTRRRLGRIATSYVRVISRLLLGTQRR